MKVLGWALIALVALVVIGGSSIAMAVESEWWVPFESGAVPSCLRPGSSQACTW